MRIYFDANALIRAIESEDAVAERLSDMLDWAEDGECNIITSELTLAETIVGPLKNLESTPDDPKSLEQDKLYRSFAEGESPIKMWPVSRGILFEAAGLRAKRPSLKLPDAIHLATSSVARCEALVSGDKRLQSFAKSFPSMPRSVVALNESELAALSYRIRG